MLFLLYLSHLFYFFPIPHIYHYFDLLYQVINLCLFPVYYIYIRLLTTDTKLEFKKHGRYLIFPAVFSFQYAVGILVMTKAEHIEYLYSSLFQQENLTGIFIYQKFVYILCRALFILQGGFYLFRSYALIVRNKEQVRKFYAGNEEQQLKSMVMLTTTLVVMILGAISLSVIGKEHFMISQNLLIFPSLLLSALLFIIGWLGYHQVPVILKQDEKVLGSQRLFADSKLDPEGTKRIREGIAYLFDHQHVYLNKELTLLQLADMIRVSPDSLLQYLNNEIGNSYYGLVNYRRASHASYLQKHNPQISPHKISELSGFSSVKMMNDVKDEFGLSEKSVKKDNDQSI